MLGVDLFSMEVCQCKIEIISRCRDAPGCPIDFNPAQPANV